MVSSFQFAPTPFLIFGTGKRAELPKLIKGFGQGALVITGAESFRKSAIGNKLMTDLDRAVEFCEFATVSGEPTPQMVDAIVSEYRGSAIDVVVAIGGGSVLDAGKAVSAMLTKTNSVENYLEGVGTQKPDGAKVPFIALPTTAGTGSETTKNAVISKIGEQGYKKSLRHDNYIPNIAIVDPELTLSCTREITAASGTDALTQLLEAYVSTKSSSFADSLAIDGLRCALRSLVKAWQNGNDLEARSDMAYAAMVSGIALANSGLGTVHGFASSIGGLYPIPHGVVCGTLMAECVAVNLSLLLENRNNPAFIKYANVGRMISDKTNQSDAYYCDLLVDTLRQWIELMQLPRLSSFGVRREDFSRIIENTDNKNNPVDLNKSDLLKILESRI